MIVGLCGGDWGGGDVGMDAAADALEDKGFLVVDLLDPVKKSATKLLGWNGVMDPEGLGILDGVCRSGRKISEHYWLNMALAPIDFSRHPDVVLKHVFFRNEHECVLNGKGVILRLVSYPGQTFESDAERTGIPVLTVVGTSPWETLQRTLEMAIRSVAGPSAV